MNCCFSKKKNKVSPREIKSIQLPEPKSILVNGKNQKKKKRRKSIHPTQYNPSLKEIRNENIKKLEENIQQREEFHKKFLSEIIKCGCCNQNFSLEDRQLQINCAICNQFFHCGIAGRCIGDNCKVIIDNNEHSLGYCKNCVNPLKLNLEDNFKCLCKICEKDKKISKDLKKY